MWITVAFLLLFLLILWITVVFLLPFFLDEKDSLLKKKWFAVKFNSMDKYERILFIDEIISSGCRPSQKDLIDALKKKCGNIDRTTVWRDLLDLERKFHAPLDIQYYTDVDGNKKRGYIYTEPKFRVPAMFSSADKIKSAKLMLHFLDSLKGTPIYDEASSVFKELSTEAPVIDRNGSARFSLDSAERIIFIGHPTVHVSDEVWKIVKDALQKNMLLKFLYKDKERTVEPYQLIFCKGNWNLWCYEYSDRRRKLFNLSEMKDVRLRSGKDREFILPDDFDFRLVTPGFFGTFLSETESLVKVKMKGYAAKYSTSRVWGDEQIVEELEDGWTLISFKTSQLPLKQAGTVFPGGPILTWILGWGDEAIPVAPQELVEFWENKVKAMKENMHK